MYTVKYSQKEVEEKLDSLNTKYINISRDITQHNTNINTNKSQYNNYKSIKEDDNKDNDYKYNDNTINTNDTNENTENEFDNEIYERGLMITQKIHQFYPNYEYVYDEDNNI